MSQISFKLGINELSTNSRKFCQDLAAEFIGTFIIIFIGSGSGINIKHGPDADPNIILISLTAGFATYAAISATFHISGGHINPSVTMGMTCIGMIKPVRGLLYIIMQCAGAITGSAVIKMITPEEVVGSLGVTSLGKNITHIQGFAMEFFLTFILLFVTCGVCDRNKPDANLNIPLTIGLTVAAGHLCALDYSGSSMNPARSLGPALMAGIWIDHWIYWVAPLTGGVVGSLCYVHVFSRKNHDVESLHTPYKKIIADNQQILIKSNNQLNET